MQLGNHQADGLGRTGAGGNHRHGGGARPVQVVVGLVEQVLVVGVGVHRGDQPLADAHRGVQHLGQRRQAVGGAGGIGDDLLVAQQVVVDAVHHRQVGAVQRVREQHARRTGGQVLLGQRAFLRLAGAVHHHVHVQLLPGQLGHVLFADQADGLAAHLQHVVVQADMAVEAAEGGVEAGQVGEGLEVAGFVDRLDVYLAFQSALEQGADQGATNAPVSVQGNAQHGSLRLAGSVFSIGGPRPACLATDCARHHKRRSRAARCRSGAVRR